MIRYAAVTMTAALFSVALLAQAPGRDLVVGDLRHASGLIDNPQFTVLVVDILEARVAEGTNENPPAGRLRVLSVLRGKGIGEGEFEYQAPAARPPDEDLETWRSIRRTGPKGGDRLIVFCYLGSRRPPPGSLLTLQGPMIRDSSALREIVVKSLHHNSPLLPLLALVVMASPFLGFRNRPPWLSAAVGLPTYFLYESLMSAYYTIRIDLLLLFPALAASILISLWKVIRRPAA